MTAVQVRGTIPFVEILSQAGGTCRVENPWGKEVTLYRNGTLVWGTEPGGGGPTNTPTRTNTPGGPTSTFTPTPTRTIPDVLP